MMMHEWIFVMSQSDHFLFFTEVCIWVTIRMATRFCGGERGNVEEAMSLSSPSF